MSQKENYEAVFSIDEIEIIELGWPNYTHEESWIEMCAYYAPDIDEWIVSKMKWLDGDYQ